MSLFTQAQPDDRCLRYPEQIPPQRDVTVENAMNMLIRATDRAQNIPFSWGYVDKPQGSIYLVLDYIRDVHCCVIAYR